MKKIKILLLLSFVVFFSSCPTMEDTSYDCLNFCIKNKTSFTFNLDVKYEIPSWPEHRFKVYEDNVKFDSTIIIKGFSYEEEPQNPFDFLMAECIKKQIVVTSLSGDTLANWNDSSMVFNDQIYWLVQPNEDGYTCTLQLTDEVLKLK